MLKTILIIEDDKSLQTYLSEVLVQENYSVKLVLDETKAIDKISTLMPDLVLLDLMLPNIKGETLCKQIKTMYPDLPVIILTGKTDHKDMIHGFDIGADDYITKPFEVDELIRRIQARLKENRSTEGIIRVSDLEINPSSLSVKRGGEEISLTAQEYKLLEYLAVNAGKVLTRENLLSKIWANSFDVETRVIDVYISYLRKKIDAKHKHKLIQSVRSFGYTIKKV